MQNARCLRLTTNVVNGTAGIRTQNQRIMSHRGTDVSPEEIAVSTPRAADGAAICFQDIDDRRLTWIKSSWPILADDVKAEIARLTGYVVDNLTMTPAGDGG